MIHKHKALYILKKTAVITFPTDETTRLSLGQIWGVSTALIVASSFVEKDEANAQPGLGNIQTIQLDLLQTLLAVPKM